ncbi:MULTISPECIES: hypothetical protein [unclassified Solwaraspora]|uniref:hypothetical protein n=1 Tax=unclassified Solwaraspora TaxID=2627926 RepID=UPI00259BD770|nr:hypothetical protein [Solwaraspora sp. WMMA2056]WJK42521.1 hypothetical protein O7608_09150 [Solwaraspora sp. WMMA2056]
MAAALLVAAGFAVVQPGGAAYADAAGKGGDYVPFATATALVDTRTGLGGTTGTRPAGSTTTFQVLGAAGVPATGVSAVMLDVTAISPTIRTHLTVWPDGEDRPVVSVVNADVGQVLSNSAIVKVGSNGRIAVHNNSGTVHVSIDVQGYFTSSAGGSGGGFVPTAHTRLVDTRDGTGTSVGAIAAQSNRTFTLTGGVVPAGATSVALDVIVVNAAVPGWIAAFPPGTTGTRSLMDFPAGTTSHAGTVTLSSSGEVTFRNPTSSPLHVVLSAQGYFTGSSSTGAGLRTLPASRLLDTRSNSGAAIPANGEIDVQVGGTNGLPTRGIAAAVLNLTAINPSSNGYLRVWPLDGTQPTPSVLNYSSTQIARGSLAFTQVGTEGKVRIRNYSSGTVHLTVDLQAWFADPMQPLDVPPYSKTVVQQLTPTGTGLGSVEYGYVDNLGSVRIGRQDNVDDYNSVEWTTISGLEAFVGPVTLSQGSDGRAQVVAQHTDSNVWSRTQAEPNQSGWSPWAQLGGSMAAPPTAATVADGTQVIFAVGDDGRLWHYRQAGTNPAWRSLGPAELTGSVTVVPAQNGLRLLASASDGSVRTAVYSNDGVLSGWTTVGTGVTLGAIAAVVNPGYRTRVVVRADDGTVVEKLQEANGTWPANWSPVGSFSTAGTPAVILDPALGRTVIVARGVDNEIYRVFETGPGTGVWGTWAMISDYGSDPAATDPTVAPVTNSNGQTFVVVFRGINQATKVYERQSIAGIGRGEAGGSATSQLTFDAHTLPAPPD